MEKSFTLLSISLLCAFFLLGCRHSSSSSESSPGQFNLLSIKASQNKVKTLSFDWGKSEHAESYTLCEKDISIANQCKPLATQLATTDPLQSMTHTFSELFVMPKILKKDFFIMASNSNGEALSAEDNVNIETYIATLGFLKASNIDPADFFGSSVSLSDDGKTLAIGAPFESGSSASSPDNGMPNSGAVYVFQNINGSWGEPIYLKASNVSARDFFGDSVSLSANGKTLAVGAYAEDSDSQIPPNENATDSGAVYVFRYVNGQWLSEDYLKASTITAGDAFGFSVSLNGEGDLLAVGAKTEDDGKGAVYVFSYVNGQWSEPEYLKSTYTSTSVQFGNSVSLSLDGLTLAVAAHLDDGDEDGSEGNSTINAGAAYVFYNTDGSWGPPDYIKASNIGMGDFFGYSLSLSADGKTLAVGAFLEDSDAALDNDDILNSGAVYVYRYSNVNSIPNKWGVPVHLKASNISVMDLFGYSVSLSADGNTLAVGAKNEGSDSSEGNDPLNPNENATQSGAVYLFHYENGLWSAPDYLKAKNLETTDQFGSSVSLSGDGKTLVVGAHQEDSSITRLNNDAQGSGAVYSF